MAKQTDQVQGLSTVERWRLVSLVSEHVAALTRPTTTREVQKSFDGSSMRFTSRTHVVEHPSLLDQLREVVAGTTGPSSSSGSYESKPAARLDAIDTFELIRRGAREWVTRALRCPSRGVLWDLQLLAARAHEISDVELAGIRSDPGTPGLERTLFRWVARARVTTGWDAPPWKPHVPCMVCERYDTLRIRAYPMTAVCLECGSAWDAATIGILGNHIQIMLNAEEHPIETADDEQRS